VPLSNSAPTAIWRSWGPPGTDKTTTLAHIVSELLAQGLRVLVLSTTNAALDQALEQIAADPEMGEAIRAGTVVRMGRSDGPTFGAALRDVVIRLNAVHQKALDRMSSRRPAVALAVRRCEEALSTLSDADVPYQDDLFGAARPRRPPAHLEDIFSAGRAAELQDGSPGALAGLIRRRTTRLVLALALYDRAIAERKKALLNKEHDVVDGASLVLSTLTNGYFSPLMAEQRFDVLIVEEASMAVLPALFYAACLGRRKTVIVGDPCQLPSIMQSNEEYVRKVMGRNIFEVAVAEPLSSPLVAMLDVQYRMHPLIGELVSDLFYAGRLKHGGDPAMRTHCGPRAPWRITAGRAGYRRPHDVPARLRGTISDQRHHGRSVCRPRPTRGVCGCGIGGYHHAVCRSGPRDQGASQGTGWRSRRWATDRMQHRTPLPGTGAGCRHPGHR
jgi:AAA domain-containing protein